MGEWLFVPIHTGTHTITKPAHETCTQGDVRSQTKGDMRSQTKGDMRSRTCMFSD